MSYIPPLDDYDLEQAKLKRRRLQAQQLADAQEPMGYRGVGGGYIAPGLGRQLQWAVEKEVGKRQAEALDQDELALAQRRMAEEQAFLQGIPTDTPTTPGMLAPGLRLPALRQAIAQQLGQTLDYPQQNAQAQAKAEGAQALAQLKEEERRQTKEEERQWREQQAEAQRQFQAGQNAMYRRTVEQQMAPRGNDSLPSTGLPDVKTTESERSAAGYLGRMQAAEELMASIPADKAAPTLRSAIMSAAGPLGDVAQRVTGSDEQNRTIQAQRDWVRAKLRKESGAVIGEQEMLDEIRTYFPMLGDSAAVVAQKAQARKQAQEQLASSAGRVAPTRAAPAPGSPLVVRSREEWQALPPGTRYALPDGRTGVR